MRSFVPSWRSLAAGLVLVTSCGAATSAVPMTDPLIGLSFDPAVVRFEEWRDSATTSKELGPMPKWIFGCAPVDGGRVCVVAGHRSVKPDGGGAAVTEPDFGGVVQETGGSQKVLGVPERLFDRDAIVSPAVRDSLLRDAVSRYIKAFGNASKLRAAIGAQIPIDTIPRPLLEALRAAGVVAKTAVAMSLTSTRAVLISPVT